MRTKNATATGKNKLLISHLGNRYKIGWILFCGGQGKFKFTVESRQNRAVQVTTITHHALRLCFEFWLGYAGAVRHKTMNKQVRS